MNWSLPLILSLVAAGLVGASLLFLAARDLRHSVWIIAIMAFATSITLQSEKAGNYGRTWLQPIQAVRVEMYIAASCLLLLAALMNSSSRHVRGFAPVLLINLVIQVFAGLLDARRVATEGWARVLMNLTTSTALLLILPALLITWENFLALMRALGAVGVLWAGCVLVQMVLDHRQMVVGNPSRFVGLLGNPQGTALYLPAQTVIVLWLVLNDTGKLRRWIWMTTLASLLLMVGWTGSRTGGLLSVIGISAVLYSRLGRGVFLLPIVGLGLYGVAALAVSLGVQVPIDRLTSSQDTRTEAWLALWRAALEAPFFGEGTSDYVENSYLLAWVIYGPLMALLVLLLVAALMIGAARAVAHRGRLVGAQRSLLDLCVGYALMYPAGTMFEWFVVARIEINILLVAIIPVIATQLIRMSEGADDGHAAFHRDDYALEPAYDHEPAP